MAHHDPNARQSPTATFFGPESERGGPFALLGVPVWVSDDQTILEAREARMRQIDAHRLGETPEADEVRLSLYAAAAQLLNPMIRSQLAERWGAGQPGTSPEALPKIQRPVVSRASVLEHDAILALAMHGGWNKRALRHIASLAHARGLSSQDVAHTLRRIGRQRRPRQTVPQAMPRPGSARGAVSPSFGKPAEPEPSLLDPLPEQIDPAQQLVKTMLIVVGVAVITLALLFGGVYAVVRADRRNAERLAEDQSSREAIDSAERFTARPRAYDAPVPPPSRELPEPEALGDPLLVVHEIEGARRGLEFTPYESTRRFAAAVDLLGGSWASYDPDDLSKANQAVVEFLESLTAQDTTRLALDSVGSGLLAIGDQPELAPGPDQVWPAVWSSGMLALIRESPAFDARIRRQIDRMLSVQGLENVGNGFGSGSVSGVIALGERLVASDAPVGVWQRWVESVDAVSRQRPRLRVSLITAVLDQILAANEGAGEHRARAIRELSLTLSWRRDSGARRWLVQALRRPRVDTAALSGLIGNLVKESGARGLDATIVLSPNATARERSSVAQRLVVTWGLDQDAQAGAFEQAWRSIALEAQRELAPGATPIERMAGAVRLAYANSGAWLASEQRFEEASRALDRAEAFRLSSTGVRPDAFLADEDARWALRYRNAGSSADARLEALEQLSKRMSSQIGPVDAEVLIAEALRGTPRSVRERAQHVATKFVSSPAMINAMLEHVDDLPRSQQVLGLVQLMTASPVSTQSEDGSWRVAARRALIRALIESLSREGAHAHVDLMHAELELAYSMAAGHAGSEDASESAIPLADAARLLTQRVQRSALRLSVGSGASHRIEQIERERLARLALSDSPIQRFLCEQIAYGESLALLVRLEQGGVDSEVQEALDQLAADLRRATHVLDQLGFAELAVLRLWSIREGGAW